MEKMPDRYICPLCNYVAPQNHEICPSCNNGKPVAYGRKPKTKKKSLLTDPNFQKKFGQMR